MYASSIDNTRCYSLTTILPSSFPIVYYSLLSIWKFIMRITISDSLVSRCKSILTLRHFKEEPCLHLHKSKSHLDSIKERLFLERKTNYNCNRKSNHTTRKQGISNKNTLKESYPLVNRAFVDGNPSSSMKGCEKGCQLEDPSQRE